MPWSRLSLNVDQVYSVRPEVDISGEFLYVFQFFNVWVSCVRYTIVLMYYALSVGLLFLFRPIISHQFCDGQGRDSTYAAMYFLPSLAVLHALFGGIICKCFCSVLFMMRHQVI